MACPTPETMKKAVVSAPAAVKVRPKSAISQGNSEGMTRWKKCEVAWTKPISDMTRASLPRLARVRPGWSIGLVIALVPDPGSALPRRWYVIPARGATTRATSVAAQCAACSVTARQAAWTLRIASSWVFGTVNWWERSPCRWTLTLFAARSAARRSGWSVEMGISQTSTVPERFAALLHEQPRKPRRAFCKTKLEPSATSVAVSGSIGFFPEWEMVSRSGPYPFENRAKEQDRLSEGRARAWARS